MTAQGHPILLSGGDALAVSARQAAIEARDSILARTTVGTSVRSAEGAQKVADLLREAKAYLDFIEIGREKVKTPILAAGRLIDDTAKQLTLGVLAEKKRLEGLLGVWQAEQNAIAQKAREEAAEKERQIRREAAEKERLAEVERQRVEQAERDRVAAEQAERDRVAREEREALEAKASKARSLAAVQRANAELEAARVRQAEADEAARQQAVIDAAHREEQAKLAEAARADEITQAIVSNRVAVVNAAPSKPQGTATRQEVCYEITDITALYEAAPYLVKLEPNVTALKAALKALPEGKQLPGVKSWLEARTSVRG
jgi:hypothetical protein